MTLLEHLLELRDRMFRAAVGVVIGLVIAMFFAQNILNFLTDPYCDLLQDRGLKCGFYTQSPVDYWLLKLKVGMYVGILGSAPIWLFQFWAFITPGLHKHERRWSYVFVGLGTPLFAVGAVLAHFVTIKGLVFLLPGENEKIAVQLGLVGYFDFVTTMMLIFGVAFLFPLVIFMLNLANIVSARRLLGWWRPAVFLCFVFTAFATSSPDPFGMTIMAIPMIGLYFAAVGAAFLNERRRAKAVLREERAALEDDEASALDYTPEPVEAPEPVEEPTPVNYADRDLP